MGFFFIIIGKVEWELLYSEICKNIVVSWVILKLGGGVSDVGSECCWLWSEEFE